jgi:putative hydrolase of the HAD superfamily
VPKAWSLVKCIVQAAKVLKMDVQDQHAIQYMILYSQNLPEFFEINRSKDMEWAKRFWNRLGIEWMTQCGLDPVRVDELAGVADELIFGPNSILFNLFDDVVPCLNRLESEGIQMAVISNWDYSLHRVLGMFGLRDRFVTVKASLEEGVEKPDPKLFEIALSEAGYEAANVVHVGDSYEDDVVGAQNAGIRVIQIDRSRSTSDATCICTLAHLPEALTWNV